MASSKAVVILVALMGGCQCGSKVPPPPPPPKPVTVDSITVTPDSVELFVGDTVQFCAQAWMSDGSVVETDTTEVCATRLKKWKARKPV